MGKLFFLILLFAFSYKSYSQSSAFDFWIGDWNLTWTDQNDQIVKGSNTIEQVLNEKVIQENFTSLEEDLSKRFIGKSWTVYNPVKNEWKQTWVDNSGSYLDFTGFINENLKGFQRSFINPKGKKIYQRMIFHDIKEDSFTWDWQNSSDGENWNLQWRINYTRKN